MVLFRVSCPPSATLSTFDIPSPGSVERNYIKLRERTDDAKQWMYVYVEQATNTYNKWTMESNPLLVVRLVAGATGLYILYRIWSVV